MNSNNNNNNHPKTINIHNINNNSNNNNNNLTQFSNMKVSAYLMIWTSDHSSMFLS